MTSSARLLFFCLFSLVFTFVSAQEINDHGTAADHHNPEIECGGHGDYDPAGVILHHIADANEFHLIGDVSIPLPVFLYAPEHGWTVGLSSMFHHGETLVDGYVMNHGRINRLADAPAELLEGHHEVECIAHGTTTVGDKTQDVYYALVGGTPYLLDAPSVGEGGLLGGGITSFYDFSITKNVFTMLLASLLLIFLWSAVARGYKKNEGKAPSGIQSLMEPFFVFLRDEITIPMIGEKHYERFQPFIFTIFFFVLFCNLLGLIPIFPGSANVTGNLAVTMALAVISAIVAYVHGNRHFWEHTLWMPGVPAAIKLFILTPVEILGLVIKPFSLMVRLFANITAGHIIILSLISLIFIFGNNGESVVGAGAGAVVGVAFTLFMNMIELLVAFVQAFIFAILSASYIGAAVEDAHHHDEAGHHGEKKIAEGGAMGGAVTGMHTPAN
ncbi:F-type H+-transporting ATPase subunit a [Lewinella marina]|uniref:ATP synthase subunit a n=1 Tax=Neolewinella marina TaxID=438751 RepID=A0A2G0CID1_9BACT|nr:F0F1 ATP synthase subunit A [Neolewinella marina]NJB85159.1 F-type H+-transporting ATPase subunit a [Neolewinella marina]PHK99708.1 ATP synthase F0 subunit A [Neolewinella marina]